MNKKELEAKITELEAKVTQMQSDLLALAMKPQYIFNPTIGPHPDTYQPPYMPSYPNTTPWLPNNMPYITTCEQPKCDGTVFTYNMQPEQNK